MDRLICPICGSDVVIVTTTPNVQFEFKGGELKETYRDGDHNVFYMCKLVRDHKVAVDHELDSYIRELVSLEMGGG